eukprot:286742-Prymnesium_polylepis.1
MGRAAQPRNRLAHSSCGAERAALADKLRSLLAACRRHGPFATRKSRLRRAGRRRAQPLLLRGKS